MRSLIALLATALPALAEPPRLSLIFGQDALEAQAEDILDTRRVDDDRGSTLSIRLSPALDAAMLALTTAHVGETGRLMICAEVVIEPVLFAPIDRAIFQISDADPARIDHLQALLASPSCPGPPGG
ncbi:hypothetical protein [Tabrizicola sp.]|uniref:hypothetical protein n=1 Tax=Tabrizicola sp. TaxID=2005166 RepID=UPI0035B10A33